jgi:hypothetical protein
VAIDIEQTIPVLTALATYANCKSVAMEKRLSGEIGIARRLEAHCDDIYKSLPDWAKTW